MSVRRRSRRAGFTLTEVLVTVAVLSVVAAVAVPVVTSQRSKSQLATAVNDGASAAIEVAYQLSKNNSAGFTNGTSSPTISHASETLTIAFPAGASSATKTAPLKLSSGSTLSGALTAGAASPTAFCLVVTNGGQKAVYTQDGYQSSAQSCS